MTNAQRTIAFIAAFGLIGCSRTFAPIDYQYGKRFAMGLEATLVQLDHRRVKVTITNPTSNATVLIAEGLGIGGLPNESIYSIYTNWDRSRWATFHHGEYATSFNIEGTPITLAAGASVSVITDLCDWYDIPANHPVSVWFEYADEPMANEDYRFVRAALEPVRFDCQRPAQASSTDTTQ